MWIFNPDVDNYWPVCLRNVGEQNVTRPIAIVSCLNINLDLGKDIVHNALPGFFTEFLGPNLPSNSASKFISRLLKDYLLTPRGLSYGARVLKPCQESMMEFFAKKLKTYHNLDYFCKKSVIDISHGPKYTFSYCAFNHSYNSHRSLRNLSEPKQKSDVYCIIMLLILMSFFFLMW